MRTYVFGYGSLINRMSAQNALKRALKQEEMNPAILVGFSRVWRAKERIYFEILNANKTGVFLDLKEKNGGHVNGVLIEVSPQELQQMKLREKNYDCIDVTKHLINHKASFQVFTFVCKPECRVKPEETEIFVPQGYLDMIKEGCEAIGPDFYSEYLQTTELPSLPVQDGKYLFVDPVQAKYI